MTMPLIVAFAAIALAMIARARRIGVFDIANFAPTLAVMIALGVGIDYALLIINRFRAERAAGADVRDRDATAIDTAGRSVLFAGTTVVIALLGHAAARHLVPQRPGDRRRAGGAADDGRRR